MFNLMAVVPDKRLGWRKKLEQLEGNCNAITKDVTSVSMRRCIIWYNGVGVNSISKYTVV